MRSTSSRTAPSSTRCSRTSRRREPIGSLRDLPLEGRRPRAAPGGCAARAPARRAVEVRVLVDADGGKEMGEEAQRRLREGGCRLRALSTASACATSARSIAATIASCWCSTAASASSAATASSISGSATRRNSEHVRDVGVRLQRSGRPRAAVGVQRELGRRNRRAVRRRRRLPGDSRKPARSRCTSRGSSRKARPPAVKILHHLVLCLARKRLWIQNPYFLPDREAIDGHGAGGGAAASTSG